MSYSYSEMYHCLLKMFVDADTNKDGLVSKSSFSKLIDAAASLPRAYGYAPEDSELYKTEAEKDAARQKMFDSMDLKSTGVITFDKWLKFTRNTLLPRPPPWILTPSLTKEVLTSTRNSSRKLLPTLAARKQLSYWYMLEIFTDHDADKDGIVKMDEFSAMMKECLATPLKHELPVPCCEQFEVLFKKYDPRNDGRLTVDEWMTLAKEEVYKKFL